MIMPAGGGQKSRRICCSGDMVGHHAQPRRHQKSGQFLVRTQHKKYRSELTEMKHTAIPPRARLTRLQLGSLQIYMPKSGHIMVRTRALKFRSNLMPTATVVSALTGGYGGTRRHFRGPEKADSFRCAPMSEKRVKISEKIGACQEIWNYARSEEF